MSAQPLDSGEGFDDPKHRERLGRYIELHLIGSGGMGAVYRAYDPQLERVVAIKLMRDASPTFRARFEREARAMARLSHPNVAQIYDFGSFDGAQDDAGCPYFVMELVRGESLARILERRGQLPAGEVVALMLQAAQGLEAAHAAGIIHRDIKPSNLVLDETGQLKLVDFGIARMEAGEGALTRPNSFIGTPHYMAPEMLAGKGVDERADIYALGLTAFHLLAGQPAFDAPSAMAVVMKQIGDDLPDLARLAPETPPELVRLIGRMADKDPGARLQSAAELVGELRAMLRVAQSAATAPARRRWLPRLQAAAVLAALLVVAGVVSLRLVTRLRSLRVGPEPPGAPGPPLRATAPAPPVPAQDGPLRVAVLPFKNLGRDRDLDVLSEGLSETVLTALGGVKEIKLLERTQVDLSLKEIDFGQTRYVDPATRAALGRIAGAQLAVQGGFQRAGGKVRVSARLVRIETGEIADTLAVTQSGAGLFELQDAVARELKRRLIAVAAR